MIKLIGRITNSLDRGEELSFETYDKEKIMKMKNILNTYFLLLNKIDSYYAILLCIEDKPLLSKCQ